MAVSIEQYRQRIGCFARVATILSLCKVRGCKRNTFPKHSNDFGSSVRVIRLSFLVVVVATVISSSSLVLDLTQLGDVEKNPGPNSAQNFKFHVIGPDKFEELAAIVLMGTYKVPFSIFKKGRDGGQDAVATRVNIDLGGGNVLANQDVIVQVKHTTDESAKLTDGTRKSVFEKEEVKVRKLVTENKLDIYIIVTNYKLPAGQSDRLKKCFKDAGAKEVIVVGYETLSLWLNRSPELQKELFRLYPPAHITDLLNCPRAIQSVQLLEQYKEDLKVVVDVEAFTEAKAIVKSEKGLVFITGFSGSGKTTAAKQLVVHLFHEYDFFDITFANDFIECWIPDQKQVFFMDNIDCDEMRKWCKLEDKLKIAIEKGSKFVFAGKTAVLEEARRALNEPGYRVFYDRLCNATIDLSDQQFNLSKDKKQEMLKKHVEMGDNDNSTKEALLKDDILSHVAGMKCPHFPSVAKFFGNNKNVHDHLETFKEKYKEKSLDHFVHWLQSPNVASESSADFGASPAPKRPRQESGHASTADNGHYMTALTKFLADEYKDRASRLHPLPWFDTTQFELDKVYTRLGIIQRENIRSQLTNKTVELSEIFDKHQYKMSEKPRTILIEGSPGMGKTTLSLKLAYDWARGRMPSTFPPVQLVLLIKCRDMKGDILETINDQLLPSDRSNLKTNLSKFIEKQPSEIILVVDGFDETPEAAAEHVMNLLTRKCLRECYIVVTSRQEKGLKVRKHFDTLLEIKGYSKNDVKEYITKYFHDKDPSLAEQLIGNLTTDMRLATLATNPLNTVLLCVVFEDYGDYGGELPSTAIKLYDMIVFCIKKRYCEKIGLAVEDKLLEASKETLGKLAYEGLLEDTLSFRESKLNVDKIHCTKMGFLYQEASERKIKPDHTYWFLHKTFQEYFAAFYFTNKVERKELTVDDMIEQLKDTTKFMQVLMFVSGMLREKDALLSKDFVRNLGTVLLQSQNMDRNQVVNILCAVLSEGLVNKDVADVIHQFLPENLICNTQYREYVSRTLPRILDLLCRKDGGSAEVSFDQLCFTDIELSTSDLRLMCKALKEKLKVRTLTLKLCSLSDETANNLADMLSHNSTVEELNLAGNYFTAKAAKIVVAGLCQNTTLKNLRFCFNDLGDVGVKAITTALTSDTSLTGMAARNDNSDHNFGEDGKKGLALDTLSLLGNECDEEGAFAVAAMLRTNNTLTTLDISRNPLGSQGVTHVAEALRPNDGNKGSALHSLSLKETECDEGGASAVAAMLRTNNTLTTLDISSNPLGSQGVTHVAEALRPNDGKKGSALHSLSLMETECDEGGAFAVATMLRTNNTLTTLDISSNPLGSLGVTHVAEALRQNDGKKGSALHSLSLMETECYEGGAFAVAAMLRTNNTLTTLDISCNPLGSEGMTSVAEALKQNRTLNSLVARSIEGAVAIAGMLRSNRTLTKLFMSNYLLEEPKVGLDGAFALAGALEVNNSLKELHLRGNYITDEGLKRISEALLVNTALDKLCINYSVDVLIALDHATRARVESRITWDCSCTNEDEFDLLYR